MLIPQKVKIKLNPRNINRLRSLGYSGKINDEILIDAKHLTKGSSVMVEVLCDYCNKNTFERKYHSHYTSYQKYYLKDCCDSCSKIRRSKISINARNITYEFIKEEFDRRGYKLVTKSLNGEAVTNIKLEYICNKHMYEGIQYIS